MKLTSPKSTKTPLTIENPNMRGIAYAVAAIAAVGIMIGIISIPSQPDAGEQDAGQPDPRASASLIHTVIPTTVEPGSLTLTVPEMHCEFACFPRVQETLASVDSVKTVELAPQKKKGTIDNRQVIVQYDAGFNVADALKRLSKEGFTESEVVQ